MGHHQLQDIGDVVGPSATGNASLLKSLVLNDGHLLEDPVGLLNSLPRRARCAKLNRGVKFMDSGTIQSKLAKSHTPLLLETMM